MQGHFVPRLFILKTAGVMATTKFQIGSIFFCRDALEKKRRTLSFQKMLFCSDRSIVLVPEYAFIDRRQLQEVELHDGLRAIGLP